MIACLDNRNNDQKIGTHIRYAKNRIIQLDNEATSLEGKTNMLKKELVSLTESNDILKQELSNSQLAVEKIKNLEEYGSIVEIAKEVGDAISDDRKP